MRALTPETAAIVKGLLARGEKQHDIAAFFSTNGGRIAEVAKGYKFADVHPAPGKDLPTPAQVAEGFAVWTARQALARARMGIDAAFVFLDNAQEERDRYAAAEAMREKLKQSKRGKKPQ